MRTRGAACLVMPGDALSRQAIGEGICCEQNLSHPCSMLGKAFGIEHINT